MVLKAAIISENAAVVDVLRAAFERTQRCGVVRAIDGFLDGDQLSEAITACAPHAVFVDVDSVSVGVKAIRALQASFPNLQVVAVSSGCNSLLILDLMTSGVREVLSNPPDDRELLALLGRLSDRVSASPVVWGEKNQILSFVPAKASAGATTLAVNTAVRLSRRPNTRALLVDLDLNSGLVTFLLRISGVHGLYEAVSALNGLDETLWRRFVADKDGLGVLAPVEMGPSVRMEPLEVHQLVSFARRLYDFVCLDHSGNLERLSLEMMRASQHIFLVCTPEIPSLHLARQRIQLLRAMELEKQVSVLLNRAGRGAMISRDAIEAMLDMEVLLELPNDYRAVQTSALAGTACDETSPLGVQCGALADWLTLKEQARLKPAKRRRFVDYVAGAVGPTR
jgi:Flp pilus assembly CpaE family ATPase